MFFERDASCCCCLSWRSQCVAVRALFNQFQKGLVLVYIQTDTSTDSGSKFTDDPLPKPCGRKKLPTIFPFYKKNSKVLHTRRKRTVWSSAFYPGPPWCSGHAHNSAGWCKDSLPRKKSKKKHFKEKETAPIDPSSRIPRHFFKCISLPSEEKTPDADKTVVKRALKQFFSLLFGYIRARTTNISVCSVKHGKRGKE